MKHTVLQLALVPVTMYLGNIFVLLHIDSPCSLSWPIMAKYYSIVF